LANSEEKVKTSSAQLTGGEKYARPKLKVFGQVGALTQGGTGLEAEGMMGMMDMTKVKN